MESNHQSQKTIHQTSRQDRIKLITFSGLAVALIAVSAWITIPIGPIPVTLQMLSIPLIIGVLSPSAAIFSIYAYVLLGAIGLPLFSGFRGSIAVLFGPTGGFLVGYLIAVPLAALVVKQIRSRVSFNYKNLVITTFIGGVIFTLVADIFGCIQYSFVANISLVEAFALSVAPFLIIDLAKVVIASLCAGVVCLALKK